MFDMHFLKVYILTVVAIILTAAGVIGLVWAYDYFVVRELNVEGIRTQEYIGKEGTFTVIYSCTRGVARVDFAPADQNLRTEK